MKRQDVLNDKYEIRINKVIKARYEMLAKELGVSMANITRILIKEFIEKNEREVK